MEEIFRKISQLLKGPEIAIFHEFRKPPYGGGNQFLIALEKELTKKGQDVGRNKVGSKTKVCLFNSYNFDFDKLSLLQKKFHPKMIHRVDGPIGTYRGEGAQMDKKIWEMNHALADRTIFQSEYSRAKHIELGLTFKNAVVIPNAVDSEIFNPIGRITLPNGNRKIRLVATAWSDNPKKGGPLLSWLDGHLDHDKYELTFVGRTQAVFKGAKSIGPVASEQLSDILRGNDIYIAPSQDDPCSNALIEALSCGLPAVFLRSGGHPELVGEAGVGFTTEEELLRAIDTVAANLKSYQEKIRVHSLSEVTDQYMKVFNS